ncbi:MAG: hypothetical protein J6K23_05615 [Bacilli bacterium]|nr:hypothetical protein [Bacilli bacterium]
MFNLLKKKNTIDKDSKIIDVVNGKIPYDEIKNEDKITFIIITQDEDVLKKSLQAIAEVTKDNKEKEINVVISSSYEKLHKITNGAL